MSGFDADSTTASGLFGHGVASGEPTESSVAIWTAVSDDVSTAVSTPVEWEVALDPAFTNVVASGALETGILETGIVETRDGDDGDATSSGVRPLTIRVDGLSPTTPHHYRFRVAGQTSPTGRFATLPSHDAAVEHFRLGIASCARLASAPFGPYADLARAEPDLVVHLGDYIYEDGAAPHDPPVTCDDAAEYRRRHAQYRREPALQELHRVAPWVAVWDDHDIADDSWRRGAADAPEEHHAWERRRQEAEAAYLDWLPQTPSDSGPTPMDRCLRLGMLADVIVLDARNAARDRPVKESGPALVAPDDDRRIISDEQWSWLRDCVDECPGWLIVCTQTQVSPLRLARLPNPRRRLRLEPFVNPDQWDGYPVERDRLSRVLAPVAGRVLLCSGDLHGRFHTALGLHGGSSAPEITTPSIASTPFAEAIRSKVPLPTALLDRWLSFLNRHVSYMELERRGSTILDVTGESIDITALDDLGGESSWRITRGRAAIDKR